VYDTAWSAGCKLGKAKKKGSWEIGYNYREIEDDAFVAELADSDFHGGGTNSKGHKIGLKYALLDNLYFGATYFNCIENRGSKDNVDILQVDLLFKF